MSSVLEMPKAEIFPPRLTVDANGQNPRKLWSRNDVHDFVRLGKLPEDGWELLEGEIIFKVSRNRPHVFTTHTVYGWLVGIFGFDYVQNQDPIRCGERNEPEPDISVLRRTHRDYLAEGDAPDATTEVRLVVEVTDSTVYQDRIVKARLYAQFGIPEYWMIDVERRQVRVHRAPQDGAYTEVNDLDETEMLLPLAAPLETAPKSVAELLP